MDVKRVIEDIQYARDTIPLSQQDLIETVVNIFYAGETEDMRAFAEAYTEWDPEHGKGNLDFLCTAADIFIKSGRDMVKAITGASFPPEDYEPGRVAKFYQEAMRPQTPEPEPEQIPDKF